MQNNKYISPQPGPAKYVENTGEQVHLLKVENQKLLQENIQLQKSLTNEQLLHSNLYKDWKKLQETAVEQEAELEDYVKTLKRKPSRFAFNGMLLITSLLIIITSYTLFFRYPGNRKIENQHVSAPATNTLLKDRNHSAPSSINVMPDSGIDGKESSLNQNSITSAIDTPAAIKTNGQNEGNIIAGAQKTNDTAQYKVRSKAYLYNEPDSNSRLNSFIVHWNNSYITLKALDDKKGFIYVVFKDNRGQTSKGWLRKFDLYQVNN